MGAVGEVGWIYSFVETTLKKVKASFDLQLWFMEEGAEGGKNNYFIRFSVTKQTFRSLYLKWHMIFVPFLSKKNRTEMKYFHRIRNTVQYFHFS